MGSSIYVFCREAELIMIMSSLGLVGSFAYKNDMICCNMTLVSFLLIIWSLKGKELKFMVKSAGFMIDRTLFKIGRKNPNLSKLKI